MLRTSLVTAPVDIPIALDPIKDEFRITGSQEDSVIIRCIKAAVSYAENYTETKIMTQTWDYYKDNFPTGIIYVPYPPIQSITHIKYYDSDEVLQTLSTAEYRTDLVSQPARIEYVNSWPTNYDRVNAVNIRFISGYTARHLVPQNIKDAIILLAADFYENRQNSTIVMGPLSKMERTITANNLLDFHKLFNPVTQ